MAEYTPTRDELIGGFAEGMAEARPDGVSAMDAYNVAHAAAERTLRAIEAAALRDAAHDWDEVPDRTPRTGTDTGPWLTARAAAIVSEPSSLAPNDRAWCHTRHQCHHWFEDECSDACDRGEHDHPNGACTPEQEGDRG